MPEFGAAFEFKNIGTCLGYCLGNVQILLHAAARVADGQTIGKVDLVNVLLFGGGFFAACIFGWQSFQSEREAQRLKTHLKRRPARSVPRDAYSTDS